MDTPATQTSSPLLQYADMPAGLGFMVEPLPDGIRITRPASRAEAIALLVAAVLFSPLLVLLAIVLSDGGPITAPIHAIRRAFRPMIIELTATTFSLSNVETEAIPEQDVTHPRQDIYDVHYVSHSNNVVIRVRNQEMIELFPFKDPRMQQWLADVLVQALRLK